MQRPPLYIFVSAFATVLAYVPAAAGQTDWPTYGHDPQSTRFSPLKQVNPENVTKLIRAWTFHMNPAPAAAASTSQPVAVAGGRGTRRARGSEATPLVVGGVMYMPTPYNRVVALEPETGKLVWDFQLEGVNPSMRGVEYWPGDRSSPPEILFGTTDGKLVALNAKTGKPVPGFGREGFVDMKSGIDNGFPSGQFSLSSPPKVYKDVVITGARVQESPSLGYSGDTRGWDVHTGKLLWQFHSVPRPGETGHDTWQAGAWEKRSGTNVWGLMSLDEKLGLVYLPYGSPTYDFYGADRKGANLFGDCLVALDALTGKLKWYFQAVHHDTWDYDLEAAPVLMDVTRNGKTIPALAEVSKQGLVYILDRRDGKPVFGIEERPVPKGDVPGEEYWPTEPFPVKPPPLARMSFKPEEVAKVTPEQEAVCTELYRADGGLHNDGPFTRYGLTGSIVFPGTIGASNWHGASYSPDLGYLFVNIMELADIGKLEKRPEGSPLPYSRTGYGRFWNPDNFWPCQAPPWGEMAAVNVNTGEIAWKVPFGVVEELEKKGIYNTGAPNIGGSIVTAGGLVFIGATNDHRFRAFDAKTGKVVWETTLESGAYATPITYLGKDGKQYIVVSAAGGSYYDHESGDSVIAFTLP
jgi:quinoprotein glucose dehydrogenase